MLVDSELLKSILGALIGGAAVYAAIKSELSDHKARITILEKSNDKAHERIDAFNDSLSKFKG